MAMTKIARTAPAMTLLMFVGLAMPVTIEPDGAKLEVRERWFTGREPLVRHGV